MENKDFIIYQAIASAAQKVFDKMNVDAGKYSAKEINAIICNDATRAAAAAGDDDAEKAPQLFVPDFDGSDIIRVSFDGYKCSFLAADVFKTLAQIETAWSVPTARRVKFIRAAAAASVAVRFDLNAVFKDVIKARLTDKKDIELRPTYANICIDTQRRAVVASDGHILNAVAVPNMYISEDAEKQYIINADLLKTGKGTLTIDTAGNCTINGQTCPVCKNLRFPNWESVAPAVAESCKIYLGVDVFKRLQKTVATVAKNHCLGHVSLSGVAGNNYITVCAVDIDFNKELKINVDVPQPLTFDFHVLIQAKRFAAVPVAVDSVYVHPFAQPGAGCLLFVANSVISLLMPLYDEKIKFAPTPGDAETRPAVAVANFAELNAENTPAALASVQDAEAPQISAPAVNVCPPAANVEILTADYTPAVDDEIKTAVNGVLRAYFWRRFSGSFSQIFGRAYLQRNNIYFDELNGRFINRAGVLFAVPAWDDDAAPAVDDDAAPAVPVLFGADAEKFIKDRAAAEDATRAAAAEDETSAPDNAVSESVPAGCPLDVETWKNLQIYCTCFYKDIDVNENYKYLLAHDVKLIFGEIYLFDRLIGRYEKEIKDYLCVNVSFSWINQENAPAPTPGDDDAAPAADPESVPTCAADSADVAEISAPAVAVSLPVAVSAKNTWYAIYQAEKLVNIVFSRAVADDIIINSLFNPGRTLDAVPVDDPNSAPETRTFGRVAVDNVPADSLPAADPESAPADNVAADSVPTPGDDAAPALLIAANFAERARRVFQIAAFFAVLLILAAAPRAVRYYIIDGAPAVAVSEISAPADNVPAWDDSAAPAADPESVAVFGPVAVDTVPADSLPAADPESAPAPQKRAKRARRVAASVGAADSADVAEKISAPDSAVFAPVAADSLAADSLAAADPESAPAPTCGADSVPVDDSAAPQILTAPAPGDDDAAPAADPESAPADNVPADSVPTPGPGAASVPAVAAAASVGPAAVLALFITL